MRDYRIYNGIVKESVNIVQLCNDNGIKIDRGNFTICPWHQDSSPSLHIYPETNTCFCFACNKQGDVIEYASAVYGIPYNRVIERLNAEYHLNLPIDRKPTLRELDGYKKAAERYAKETEERKRKSAKRFDEWVHLNLLSNRASRYLKEYAPTSPDDEPHPSFIWALNWKDYLDFEISNFNWEVDNVS